MKIEGRLRVRRLKEGIRMKHVTSERRATSAGGEEHTHRGERRGEAAHTGKTGETRCVRVEAMWWRSQGVGKPWAADAETVSGGR